MDGPCKPNEKRHLRIRDGLSSDDKIAFILTILRIQRNYKLSISCQIVLLALSQVKPSLHSTAFIIHLRKCERLTKSLNSILDRIKLKNWIHRRGHSACLLAGVLLLSRQRQWLFFPFRRDRRCSSTGGAEIEISERPRSIVESHKRMPDIYREYPEYIYIYIYSRYSTWRTLYTGQ